MRLITKIFVGVSIITAVATVKYAVEYVAEHIKAAEIENVGYFTESEMKDKVTPQHSERISLNFKNKAGKEDLINKLKELGFKELNEKD